MMHLTYKDYQFICALDNEEDALELFLDTRLDLGLTLNDFTSKEEDCTFIDQEGNVAELTYIECYMHL